MFSMGFVYIQNNDPINLTFSQVRAVKHS